jgi:hypothetical protein
LEYNEMREKLIKKATSCFRCGSNFLMRNGRSINSSKEKVHLSDSKFVSTAASCFGF